MRRCEAEAKASREQVLLIVDRGGRPSEGHNRYFMEARDAFAESNIGGKHFCCPCASGNFA